MKHTLMILKQFVIRILSLLLISTIILGQHRGDFLEFQGISNFLSTHSGYGDNSVFGTSSNNLKSIYINPGGLGTIEQLQMSLAVKNSSVIWRENQEYRPNRLFVTLPFYLEGLYIPDPANNGVMDYDLALDSSYVVSSPELGQGEFSEEAAEWQIEKDLPAEFNLALALPLNFSKHKLTLAVAYSIRSYEEYDRNHTYLDPHMGYSDYNDLTRLEADDSVRVNWYDFIRYRSGESNLMTFGVGYQVNKQLSFGLSLQSFSANTDDNQQLDKVGYFILADENEFSFSYDTLFSLVSGTSEFQSTRITLGGLFQHEVFKMGLSLTLPGTIERTWDYDFQVSTNDTIITYRTELGAQSDKLHLPAIWNFGFGIAPHNNINFYFDLEYGAFSLAELDLYSSNNDTLIINPADSSIYVPWADTTSRDWVDRAVIRTGLDYTPFSLLTFLFGYQYEPQIFIPDGQAFKDTGPAAQNFALGIRFNLNRFGTLTCMYSMRSLKYYDSYFSNTNYSYQSNSGFNLDYMIVF